MPTGLLGRLRLHQPTLADTKRRHPKPSKLENLQKALKAVNKQIKDAPPLKSKFAEQKRDAALRAEAKRLRTEIKNEEANGGTPGQNIGF